MANGQRSIGSAKEIRNKKASHDYFIEDKFDAGIVLQGTEVKSIRQGHAQISDAFVRFNRSGEAVLFNANIEEYSFGNVQNHEIKRARKLLLHKNELRKLKAAIEMSGLTVLPLRMFFRMDWSKLKLQFVAVKSCSISVRH